MKSVSAFVSRRGIGLVKTGMALILLLSLYPCGVAAASPSHPRVGGLCSYKQYRGEAEIVSVTPRPGGTGEYEIKFAFHPQETIQEEFVRTEGKQWSIVQKDSSYPREDFLMRYGIKTGKRLPCYLKVITKGTCTPVLFDFPTIKTGKAK